MHREEGLKVQSYLCGEWQEGSGQGTLLFEASSGDRLGSVTCEGVDLPGAFHYARSNGEKLRKIRG